MLIHGTNCFGMPLMFDTTKIDATCCDQVEFWQVVLFLNSGKLFVLQRFSSIIINGITITHKGDIEGCKKMAEVINTIIDLERQDPPIDMEKYAEIGKPK